MIYPTSGLMSTMLSERETETNRTRARERRAEREGAT